MSIEKSTKQEIEDLDASPVPPRNPENEKFIEEVYIRNYLARGRKETLVDLLNKEDFSEEAFRSRVDSWNENEGKTKGFSGQHSQIETLRGTRGELGVYYFRGSDAVKFDFKLY